jgi:hypothetical protein
MDEVEAIARQGNPEDDKRLIAAIQESRRREKELARTFPEIKTENWLAEA